jgi:hypothetical protein
MFLLYYVAATRQQLHFEGTSIVPIKVRPTPYALWQLGQVIFEILEYI